MLLKLFDFFNSCRSCWTELTPFWKCALLSWGWGCRSCSRRWWRAGKVSECTWIRGRRSCGQLRTATCSSTRYARHPVHSTLTFVKLLISWKIQKILQNTVGTIFLYFYTALFSRHRTTPSGARRCWVGWRQRNPSEMLPPVICSCFSTSSYGPRLWHVRRHMLRLNPWARTS